MCDLYAADNITFAFTTDYRSQIFEQVDESSGDIIGGAARLGSVVKHLRLHSDRFIFLDSGNHFAGYLYNKFDGALEIELMNNFRYDAMALGPTELSISEDVFDSWARLARFPILLSNYTAPPQCKFCRHIQTYSIQERSGLIIGIFSLVAPNSYLTYHISPTIEIPSDPINDARAIVDVISEKCDIIVLLSHLDTETNMQIAREVCDIDLIICNQWGMLPDKPIEISESEGCKTVIAGIDERSSAIGVLNSSWDRNKQIVDYQWQSIALVDSIPLDGATHDIVETYRDKLPQPEIIGSTHVELDGRNAILRGSESNLGNLIADAMASYYPEADFALFPAGIIYGNSIIQPRPLTDIMIDELLPYNDKITLIELTGEELKRTLERSACCMDISYGGFLQFSKQIQIEIDTSKSPQKIDLTEHKIVSKGSRVRKFLIDGSKIEDETTYKIASADFLSKGGYGYFWLQTPTFNTSITVAEVLKDYVRENSPITTQFEKRILVVP